MTKKLVGWFVLLPLCAVLALFALANRHAIEVRFDPFAEINPLLGPVQIPLFVVIYAVLIVGVVLGGTASWFAQGKQRREKRQWRKKARDLEAARTRNNAHTGADSARGSFPVIEGP